MEILTIALLLSTQPAALDIPVMVNVQWQSPCPGGVCPVPQVQTKPKKTYSPKRRWRLFRRRR